MSIANDQTFHYKTIKKTCYSANIVYLLLHVFYLILFIIAKFYILAYVTGAVVAIYALCFLLLQKKKYYIYALVCGNVFLAFVSVTTVMLGFSTGFHFYIIALCVVSFFTSYFSKNKNIKGSLVWVVLSLTIYLVLYFVTKYNAPYYAIESWIEMTLFTLHAVIVFIFIATYLLVFIKYALSLENRIMNESRTDELTQISNRYGLYDYCEQVKDKSSMVLALFDVDDFKNINDKHGHVAGDYILKRVAEICAGVLNDSFVCRYGGEEFVIVTKDEEGDSGFAKMDALRKHIEKQVFEFEGAKMSITVTIGLAKYTKELTLEQWVEIADEKMYRGKNTGKNKTVV